MNQRRVGKSGLFVSEIGLGCNNFGFPKTDDTATSIVHRALELGVTLFDTAPVYGTSWGESEAFLGKALGARRKDVVIATKFGLKPDFSRIPSRARIVEGVEESLSRLNTDYIDLFLLHWSDGVTPIEETLRALDDVIRAGKVRYIGCCNLPAWQVVEARWVSKSESLNKFIVTQDEYSLANRKAESSLLPAIEAYDMGLIPYAPLANGLLTGKFSKNSPPPEGSRLAKNMWNMGDRYLTDSKLELADRLNAFAKERGHSLLELAVSWILANPAVSSVIAGANTLEQFEQNAAASGWELTPEELSLIDQLCEQAG